jgi:hypothetical protein
MTAGNIPASRRVAVEQWSRRRFMKRTTIKRIGEGLKKEYDVPRDLPDAMQRLVEELRRRDLADKDAATDRQADVPPRT